MMMMMMKTVLFYFYFSFIAVVRNGLAFDYVYNAVVLALSCLYCLVVFFILAFSFRTNS